jgi:hypothetical protein
MHPAQEPGQLACARDPRPAHRSFSASTCTRTNRTSRRTVTASFFAGRSGRPTAPTISGPRCCSNCRTGLRRMDSGTTSLLPLQWGLTTLQTLLDSFHPALAPSHLPPDGTSLRWAERLPYRRLAVWRRVLMFWRRPKCLLWVLESILKRTVTFGQSASRREDFISRRCSARPRGHDGPADDRWIAQQITEA